VINPRSDRRIIREHNQDFPIVCLTAAMFFLECTIGPSWAVPMHVGGNYSGTVSGMVNMAGNIGGTLSLIVFGILVQYGS
jgi:hypothetical protein